MGTDILSSWAGEGIYNLCVLGCALSLVLHAGVNILFASVLVNHCQHS
jgi:hypothetical protein